MSYHLYIDALEEIRNRLYNSTPWAVFPLFFPVVFENKNYVRVGDRTMAEGNDQLPSMQLLWGGSEENYDYIGRPASVAGDVNITLRLHYPVDDPNQDNIYYDKTARKGILYFIEDMLDVLNTAPDGSLDPQLGMNTQRALHANIGPITKEGNDKLICDIELKFKTKPVQANQRYSE